MPHAVQTCLHFSLQTAFANLRNCCASLRKHILLVSDVRRSAVTTLVDYSHFVLPIAICVGAKNEDQFWLTSSPIVWHALSSMTCKPLLELLLAYLLRGCVTCLAAGGFIRRCWTASQAGNQQEYGCDLRLQACGDL